MQKKESSTFQKRVARSTERELDESSLLLVKLLGSRVVEVSFTGGVRAGRKHEYQTESNKSWKHTLLSQSFTKDKRNNNQNNTTVLSLVHMDLLVITTASISKKGGTTLLPLNLPSVIHLRTHRVLILFRQEQVATHRFIVRCRKLVIIDQVWGSPAPQLCWRIALI